MSYAINRVVVIGSGTMGGGIAAHVANAGLPVYLLDIAPSELTPEERKRGLTLDHPKVRNRIVAAALDRLKKSKPAAFFTPQAAELVTIGNLEDNFAWVGEGDWIVEAIVERDHLRSRVSDLEQQMTLLQSRQAPGPVANAALDNSSGANSAPSATPAASAPGTAGVPPSAEQPSQVLKNFATPAWVPDQFSNESGPILGSPVPHPPRRASARKNQPS